MNKKAETKCFSPNGTVVYEQLNTTEYAGKNVMTSQVNATIAGPPLMISGIFIVDYSDNYFLD